jgi:Transposase DDE domain group 1
LHDFNRDAADSRAVAFMILSEPYDPRWCGRNRAEVARQQLAQWNAHYDERCFLPIHVYDEATGAPVTVILRPGKTPSGVE